MEISLKRVIKTTGSLRGGEDYSRCLINGIFKTSGLMNSFRE